MPRIKRYDRATLMRLLEQRCPEALAKIPPPKAFDFRRHDPTDELVLLKIGMYRSGDENSRYTAELSWDGRRKPHILYGNGYSYCTASVLRENSFFNKLADWESPDASSDIVAALVAFVFVYCGEIEEFPDFHQNSGLSCLVSALQKISSRIPDGERIEEIKFGERGDRSAELGRAVAARMKRDEKIAATEIESTLKPGLETSVNIATDCEGGDGSKRFVPEGKDLGPTASSNKRSLDHEDDNTTAAKKHRIC